jgi:hypothetical protein
VIAVSQLSLPEQSPVAVFPDEDRLMAKFDQVTVVAVDGGSDGRNAVYSICRTVAELPGSRGLLIAAAKPTNLPEDVQFVAIDRLDYSQYSLYVIQCLYYHIRTDFALIVQDDGWALNGSNWDDRWFEYDYVGAPNHVAGVDGRLYLEYSWVGHSKAIQVLQGGFSLRSRLFLEAPTKYGICYKITGVPVLGLEDIQLCLMLRESLERRGLRFAPIEIALHFSVEYMHPVVHQRLDLERLFGHHRQTRRLRSHCLVQSGMTQEEIDRSFGEAGIIALLERYGYTVIRRA